MTSSRLLVAGAVLLATTLTSPCEGRAQVAAPRRPSIDTIPRPAANAADVATPDAILKALYDVISGPAGAKRDWNRFRSIMLPNARLIPTRPMPNGGASAAVWSADDYSSAAGGMVATICHGPWILISAGIVRGRRLTSTVGIRDDVTNAGATWVDEPVVVDGHIISSRVPRDLPAFGRAMVQWLEQA